MKKIASILSCVVLLTSCEKLDEHYTFETTVPGTNVQENQLHQPITFENFQNATEGIRYEYYHGYPCFENDGKVYYSTIKKDGPQYYGCDFPRQIEFDAKQIQYYYAEALSYIDYTYDEATCLLKGFTHPGINDNGESKVIYVDSKYLIFETKGIAQHHDFCSDNAEFSRLVYKKTDDLLIPDYIF